MTVNRYIQIVTIDKLCVDIPNSDMFYQTRQTQFEKTTKSRKLQKLEFKNFNEPRLKKLHLKKVHAALLLNQT